MEKFSAKAQEDLTSLEFEKDPYSEHINCIKSIIQTLITDKILEEQQRIEEQARDEVVDIDVEIPEMPKPKLERFKSQM